MLSLIQFQVRIGEHDWNATSEGKLQEMTIDVKKYTVHESYSTDTQQNDITVIELAKEVDLTIYTPACMAKTSDGTFAGKNAWLYGNFLLFFIIVMSSLIISNLKIN